MGSDYEKLTNHVILILQNMRNNINTHAIVYDAIKSLMQFLTHDEIVQLAQIHAKSKEVPK